MLLINIYRYLPLLVLLGMISACSQHPAKQQQTNIQLLSKSDTLIYAYKSVKQTYNEAPQDDNSVITHVEESAMYPVFKGASLLQERIDKALMQTFAGKAVSVPFRHWFFLDSAWHANNDTLKLSKEDVSAEMGIHINITVAYQKTGLTVMNVLHEEDGGAHPNTDTWFINWDTRKNRELKLSDLLTTGYIKELNRIAEKQFRVDKGLTAQESLSSKFSFDNDTFTLSGNFEIKPEGLMFYYNSYQIAPYSEGPTELLLTYASIKHLLRPDAVVNQFIKK